MSHLKKLKTATSRKELAKILGYTPSSLTAIVYKIAEGDKYETFEIDKKSGGKRIIKAPIPKLKKLQSHLSNMLYQCLEEIESDRQLKPISFGFRKDRSIADNASKHKRRRWVLNLDLADFFPTFNFGRVRGFFLKDNAFELHPEVATTIAQIACDGTALPQGSPCSPVISELICQILDMRMLRLAKKYGVTYSRYADDITFSTNQREFPTGLASQDSGDSTIWNLSEELVKKVENAGFTINDEKTRMHFRGSRQTVTGLVVNEKVQVPSDYHRRARAMCHALFETGKYYRSEVESEDEDKEGELEPDLIDNLNPLEGILSFIYSVAKHGDHRPIEEQRKHPTAIARLYRRFLFYKYFVTPKNPLILTEGKTDPVYLREAVKRRDSFHPGLGKPEKDGFKHAIRYFNYGGLAHDIMGLGGGGTSNLKSVPLDYARNLYPKRGKPRAITHRPMKFPVVVVLDNDDGLGPLASTIKDTFGVRITRRSTDDFYHVTDNLYVVKTPEDGDKKTFIEGLFPEKWLKKKLNGKSFNAENKIDPEKEYSKEVFAKSVIKPNAKNIDFSGFDPLLERIQKAILDYQTKLGN
jgi:retron-type reverse transcriptase